MKRLEANKQAWALLIGAGVVRLFFTFGVPCFTAVQLDVFLTGKAVPPAASSELAQDFTLAFFLDGLETMGMVAGSGSGITCENISQGKKRE